ncbi:hypothetical protein ACTHSJ_26350 [Paenibacillus cellulositrophicus]|uniref:Uncharacterized protein n=1 Tax=Paenibacillus rhizosphaerae TaxID=297318 RepID=A0A1R1EFQ5_9BACL|nr:MULTISPECIES: hypothetical protein [Paenibacillus]MCM3001303.1 hypothetical protein [Paenibacillus cellulositrophicus]OMF50648.1 hypothetical protein BK138_27040 [Paenibacillus rhizosphaerae]
MIAAQSAGCIKGLNAAPHDAAEKGQGACPVLCYLDDDQRVMSLRFDQGLQIEFSSCPSSWRLQDRGTIRKDFPRNEGGNLFGDVEFPMNY